MAAAGRLILIAGDVVTTDHRQAQADRDGPGGVAWLSGDGGATWAPASGRPTGHGAQPQVAA